MTPAMSGIREWLMETGYGPVTHHPDNDRCNETLELRVNGYRIEIELGGPYCTAGAKEGFVALCYQAGGQTFELADPAMFDRLHAHLHTLKTKKG
jgi:hypothetical protein